MPDLELRPMSQVAPGAPPVRTFKMPPHSDAIQLPTLGLSPSLLPVARGDDFDDLANDVSIVSLSRAQRPTASLHSLQERLLWEIADFLPSVRDVASLSQACRHTQTALKEGLEALKGLAEVEPMVLQHIEALTAGVHPSWTTEDRTEVLDALRGFGSHLPPGRFGASCVDYLSSTDRGPSIVPWEQAREKGARAFGRPLEAALEPLRTKALDRYQTALAQWMLAVSADTARMSLVEVMKSAVDDGRHLPAPLAERALPTLFCRLALASAADPANAAEALDAIMTYCDASERPPSETAAQLWGHFADGSVNEMHLDQFIRAGKFRPPQFEAAGLAWLSRIASGASEDLFYQLLSRILDRCEQLPSCETKLIAIACCREACAGRLTPHMFAWLQDVHPILREHVAH